MADFFSNYGRTLEAPASKGFDITPHDTNALPVATRAVYIGGAGNLVCRFVGSDADVTFSAVPAGTILPIRAGYVRATSTATLMIGLA